MRRAARSLARVWRSLPGLWRWLPGLWRWLSGLWRSLPGLWRSLPGLWRSLPGLWRSLPGLWRSLPGLWRSLPGLWRSLPGLWRSLPGLWRSLPGLWRSLPGLWRRLGLGKQAAVVAVVVAALIVVAGSSHQDPKPPSRPAAQAEIAGAYPVLSEGKKRVAAQRGRRPRRGGAEYYRRTARKRVPEKGARAFLPLYREAARRFVVNWRLIASIHRQETAFSTAPSTYHGLNDFGCCAGPMQFNVTNGPVSTWELYRHAYREGRRPKRYPHRTRKHPSIYDDFDAIMAAGLLLSDSGAGPSLDDGAWTAAYSYYGHDLFGVTYASQVLARAVAWERDGFCPNCPLDEGLVAEFDDVYGESVRRELLAAERRRKTHEKHKRGRDDKGDRRARRKARDRRSADRGSNRSPAGGRRPSRKTKPSPPRPRRGRSGPTEPSPPPPTTTQPSTTPPTTAPAPPPAGCSPIRKLLGCRP